MFSTTVVGGTVLTQYRNVLVSRNGAVLNVLGGPADELIEYLQQAVQDACTVQSLVIGCACLRADVARSLNWACPRLQHVIVRGFEDLCVPAHVRAAMRALAAPPGRRLHVLVLEPVHVSLGYLFWEWTDAELDAVVQLEAAHGKISVLSPLSGLDAAFMDVLWRMKNLEAFSTDRFALPRALPPWLKRVAAQALSYDMAPLQADLSWSACPDPDVVPRHRVIDVSCLADPARPHGTDTLAGMVAKFSSFKRAIRNSSPAAANKTERRQEYSLYISNGVAEADDHYAVGAVRLTEEMAEAIVQVFSQDADVHTVYLCNLAVSREVALSLLQKLSGVAFVRCDVSAASGRAEEEDDMTRTQAEPSDCLSRVESHEIGVDVSSKPSPKNHNKNGPRWELKPPPLFL